MTFDASLRCNTDVLTHAGRGDVRDSREMD